MAHNNPALQHFILCSHAGEEDTRASLGDCRLLQKLLESSKRPQEPGIQQCGGAAMQASEKLQLLTGLSGESNQK